MAGDELVLALARADRSTLAAKRGIMVQRMLSLTSTPTNDELLRLSREIYG